MTHISWLCLHAGQMWPWVPCLQGTPLSVSHVPECPGFFWMENPHRSSFTLHLCLQNTGWNLFKLSQRLHWGREQLLHLQPGLCAKAATPTVWSQLGISRPVLWELTANSDLLLLHAQMPSVI